MDLQLKNKTFLVFGASSGLGRAVAEALLKENATVIGVARRKALLKELEENAGFTAIEQDMTADDAVVNLVNAIGGKQVDGILLNGGGPPAMQTLETKIEDWDAAYHLLLRWKVVLLKHFIPLMQLQGWGRVLFVESGSVKQPLENLVLSNAFRVAVVNMAKTLSQEIAGSNVTLNVLAPGSHDTDAINRVYEKKSEQTGLSFDEVRMQAINGSPMKRIGDASDFASLAVWFFSDFSKYINGQTITVDGGINKSIFG
ncbi:SDR family oxidoreductase [Polluticaenibacter yanchengensis]|uniref:SDR family oxidoreductase n=1 Tax=Polluticaenibacter yanchengensis TaxID=3014562 RepID=A0ABT4UFH7_9BACT|nr:SDR family oxidoreductase [Chitinophagaceae bacterium LY-5]